MTVVRPREVYKIKDIVKRCDPRAFAGESNRHRAADSPSGSGDQGHLSVKHGESSVCGGIAGTKPGHCARREWRLLCRA